MAGNNLVINQGAPLKSSIPLVENKFGRGFGFNKPSSREDDREITIDLSASARRRISPLAKNSDHSSKSPLNQALDALSDISEKISSLQDKYSKSRSGNSESLLSELKSLAEEYKRITGSNVFNTTGSGSLDFEDSLVKTTLASENQDRIDALNHGLDGLKSLSMDEILTDRNISKNIQKFISEIKEALNPETKKEDTGEVTGQAQNSIVITVPQASIKTIGHAEGLSVSLLSYSNEDLIKAAAAKMDINSTNVLLLTYNVPEPSEETEEEKEEREKKSYKIEIEGW